MPSNLNPLGALPARFRRERVLIVGCGDVGVRVAGLLAPRLRVMALTSSRGRVPALRAQHITPLVGNLDERATLRRLAGLATRVVHLAPPPGDNPAWRTDLFGRSTGTRTHVLRIPGIYAPDREGGTPRARLLKGTAVLTPQDDVYTNHIHADDLARACAAALWRGKPQRVTNASDDTQMHMGEYFDFAAGLYGLPKPPRVPRSTAQEQLPLMLLSFMSESRRLENTRLKQELRLRLKYPTVVQGLQAG
ncbi:MAG: NAD(P)-dependent oxidoreductase [Polaromonas sp. 39-63-203]|nr:MAG: NAD(P)-dependent oxidoreductase [Polaromonas sp. 39-63-203]